MCVDESNIRHILDSSESEHRHVLSYMLFDAFLDYKNKTLVAFWSIKPWLFPCVLFFLGCPLWDGFVGFESFRTQLYSFEYLIPN